MRIHIARRIDDGEKIRDAELLQWRGHQDDGAQRQCSILTYIPPL